MLKYSSKSHSVSKLGNSAEENEDNILEASQADIKASTLIKFAIADGATESPFSKEWSDLLVSAYKERSFERACILETLKVVSTQWQSMIITENLPWYAQQKVETGSFATFIGLTINTEEDSFDAIAVGDCSLFQIRNNELILSFPISNVSDFNNTPNLIGSNEKYRTHIESQVKHHKGHIEPNDFILLTSDALAVWILEQRSQNNKIGKSIVKSFRNFNETTFKKWLSVKRGNNQIRNDDVSILIIECQ